MGDERADSIVGVLDTVGRQARVRKDFLHQAIEMRRFLLSDTNTHRTGEIFRGLRKLKVCVQPSQIPARLTAQRDRRSPCGLVTRAIAKFW